MFSSIPLPQVVPNTPQGGNIVGSMQAQNALTRSNLENKYYVPTMIGQVLSNPTLTALLPANTANALATQYNNALSNTGYGGTPGQPFGRQALSWLSNKLFGGSTPSSNALTQTPQPQDQTTQTGNQETASTGATAEASAANAGLTPDDPAYAAYIHDWHTKYDNQNGDQSSSNGNANIPSTAYPSGSMPSSTVGNVENKVKVPGSQGGINAPSAAQAQAQALNTTATTQASGQQQTWTDRVATDSNTAKNSQNTVNTYDQLRDASNNLSPYEQGQVYTALGTVPAFTTNANLYDTYVKNLANDVATSNINGQITDTARTAFQGMKPGRNQPKEARNDLINFGQGMHERLLELPAFDNAAQAKNLTPGQASAVWTYYNNHEPFYYKAKDGRTYVNKDALGNWNNYLSDNNIKKALQGYKPNISSGAGITEPTSSSNDKPYKMEFGETNNQTGGFDPASFLKYKFKDANEFNTSLSTLNSAARTKVLAEMKRRGWK